MNNNLNNSNNTLLKSLIIQVEHRDILLKQSERELEVNLIKLNEESRRLKNAIQLNKFLIVSLITSIIMCIYFIYN